VFELVLVVQHWIVELSVHPHSVDDFEPALGQATQGIGVTLTFIAMVAVVDFGPSAPGQGLLGKQPLPMRSKGERASASLRAVTWR
jgi:hypothetical protein